MARFALDGALQSHGELQWPKDTEWAFLAMAYLRICATFQDEQNQQSPGAIERVLLGLEDCKGEANGVHTYLYLSHLAMQSGRSR